MKTKYSFELMELDGGIVAVPVGKGAEKFRGVLKVNETAAEILKLLEKDTNESIIVDKLQKDYSGNRDEIAGFVHDYVQKLIEEGIVE